jgi:hypothetical protein
MRDVLDLISKFGEKENTLTSRVFVSPVFDNDTVVMRLDGVIFNFRIARQEPGWYKFRPRNNDRARKVGVAEFEDVEAYLRKLPQIRVFSCYREDNKIFGLPMKNNKLGLPHTDLTPVLLPDDMPMDFDSLLCRFDGRNLWYEGVDMNCDPTKADYLRESMEKLRRPQTLDFKGLTTEEKASYTFRFNLDKKLKEAMKMNTLEGQIEFQGGKLISYNERSDHIELDIEVDGERFRSYVSKDEHHKVVTAGICLDGMDKDYDLTSLISVFREGMNRGLIHKTLR